MESAIKLCVFSHKDGFGVAIKSLSQGAIQAFEDAGINLGFSDESKGLISVYVRSERLKFTKLESAAKDWKERFYRLTLIEQVAKIGYKWIKEAPKDDKVIVNVQYFKVMRGRIQIFTSYDLQALLPYQNSDVYEIVPSVKRQLCVTKADREAWKDRIIEVAVEAKGLVGMTRNVKDIKKTRPKGQDRHPGYRTTTSPNFYKG